MYAGDAGPTARLGVVTLAALLGGAACAPKEQAAPCNVDGDCPLPGEVCVGFRCAPGPDAAAGIDGLPDMTTWDEGYRLPDFTLVDLAGPCPPGTRTCERIPGQLLCILNSWCCTDADCAGSRCNDLTGRCSSSVPGLCPPGSKACGEVCIANASCCTNDDCSSKICLPNGACKVPACDDGALNGNETDVDCGGGFCGACSDGRACMAGGDCRSSVCLKQRCASPGFSARRYGGGSGPARIVAVDLDGDGDVDLASANPTSNNVSVALGRGDGRFLAVGSQGGSFAVGVDPADLAAADVDGDQRLDLVVANRGSYDVSVLLGYGDGSFAPERRFAVGAGPGALVIAELNGDGRLDIATANPISGTVSVLAGKGDGTFAGRRDFAVGPHPAAVGAGDLDRDGRNDLIAATDGRLAVVLSRSNAGVVDFAPALLTPTALGNTQRSLALGDLDGDGKLDAVVGSVAQGGQVFLGAGNGNLLLAGAVAALGDLSQVVLADLDRDQRLDAATPAGVLLGRGGGALGAPLAWPRSVLGMPSLALADLDGDGALDLALPRPFEGTLIAVPGNGDGTVRAYDPMDPGTGSSTDLRVLDPRFAALADLDGDGRDDLIATSSGTGQLWVQRANPDGSMGAPALYAVGPQPAGLAVADLDEDGHPDVAVACAAGDGAVLLGSKGGVLTRVVPGQNQPPPLLAPFALVVAAGDVDRDGHVDLAIADAGGGRVLRGRGDGTFDADHPLTIDKAGGAHGLQLADLDGDGALDVVLADGQAARVALSRGVDGMGRHRGFGAATALQGDGGHVADARAADLDGDGVMDLALVESDAASLQVRWGRRAAPGTFALAPPLAFAIAGLPLGLAILDVDRDGQPDLAAALSRERRVSVLRNLGQRALGDLVSYEVAPGPVRLAVGDTNHDGQPDLVAASPGTGVTVLVNTR